LKQQNDVLWHNQVFALVKPPIIDLKNVETIRIRLGELIQEPLIALGIDMGKLQKKGLSRCRLNRTLEPKCFEDPLPLANRLDTASSDQSPDDGFEPKATLILGKVANRSLILTHLALILT
jgi:hypothetical protein